MRRFYLYWLTLAIGLLTGMILTERRHSLALRDAESAARNDPQFKEMVLDNQIKRALYPEFDQIMRDIEEKFSDEQ